MWPFRQNNCLPLTYLVEVSWFQQQINYTLMLSSQTATKSLFSEFPRSQNQNVSPQRHTGHSLEVLLHIPSQIYFSNLLGSAAKPDHSKTPWRPTRRWACQLDEAEGSRQAHALEPHVKASFPPPSKPRWRPARLFISRPTQSEWGRCQHMRSPGNGLSLLTGRD